MARYVVHRLDANHEAIRDALIKAGASVDPRCPADLLVGFRHKTYILEVKTARGQSNPRQHDFALTWQGHYAVVRSVDEALKAIGAVR